MTYLNINLHGKVLRNFFLLLNILLVAGCAKNYPVRLGDTVVQVQQERQGTGKDFVHLHQNETTALKAARTVIKSEGGSVLTLVHKGQRNIVFHLQNRRYEFDPNRIFTDAGIKKTLTQFGPYSQAAHVEVRKLSEKIKILLPKGKVIAVHNNHESYSMRQYLPGQPLATEAKALHYLNQNYYRNFYLVTQRQEFNRLKKLNFNSILQALNAEDDGSLSVYLSRRDYVNVEAGYDQLAEQIKMLQFA